MNLYCVYPAKDPDWCCYITTRKPNRNNTEPGRSISSRKGATEVMKDLETMTELELLYLAIKQLGILQEGLRAKARYNRYDKKVRLELGKAQAQYREVYNRITDIEDRLDLCW